MFLESVTKTDVHFLLNGVLLLLGDDNMIEKIIGTSKRWYPGHCKCRGHGMLVSTYAIVEEWGYCAGCRELQDENYYELDGGPHIVSSRRCARGMPSHRQYGREAKCDEYASHAVEPRNEPG